MENVIRYRDWEKLFKDFSINVASQNYAGTTGAMYKTYALEFILWCERNRIKSIDDVKANHLAEYLVYLETRPLQRREGVLSASSLKHHMASIGMLFDYAYAAGTISYTVPFPKLILSERNIKNVLTLDEIRQMFSVCENPRDEAILTLAYGCGLRRTELHWLDTGDVLTHSRIVYVREGKSRKNRAVPLSDKSVVLLKQYERQYRPAMLRLRKDDIPEPAYILNANGRRLGGDSIYKRIISIANKTENKNLISKNVTTHLLRHSIATHLLERGASLEWTQTFLGHDSMDSTHIYAKNRKLTIMF